jgi:Outer membrane protein beta-barrel domain
MKLHLLISLCIIITFQLFSAEVDIETQGLKGGFNNCNLNFEGHMADSQSKFIIGSYSTYKSNSALAFQGEAFITMKGANVGPYKYDFLNLDVDLLTRIDLLKENNISPYFLVGPYIGIKVIGEVDSRKITDARPFDFGGIIAAGLKIDKFSIEYRYNPGITTIAKGGANLKHVVSSILFGIDIEKKSWF